VLLVCWFCAAGAVCLAQFRTCKPNCGCSFLPAVADTNLSQNLVSPNLSKPAASAGVWGQRPQQMNSLSDLSILFVFVAAAFGSDACAVACSQI
jgi:hypothetical protein